MRKRRRAPRPGRPKWQLMLGLVLIFSGVLIVDRSVTRPPDTTPTTQNLSLLTAQSNLESYQEGQLPGHLAKLDKKYSNRDSEVLGREVVAPALLKATNQDQVAFVKRIATEIVAKGKQHKLTIVYVLSFFRNERERPIRVYPEVQGSPVRIREKGHDQWSSGIMLFLPALDQEITTLTADQFHDHILAVILHEYLHLTRDPDVFKKQRPHPEVVAAEAKVWREQIEEMLLPMQQQKRYLSPGARTATAAYQQFQTKHPSQWVAWVAQNLAHPQ